MNYDTDSVPAYSGPDRRRPEPQPWVASTVFTGMVEAIARGRITLVKSM